MAKTFREILNHKKDNKWDFFTETIVSVLTSLFKYLVFIVILIPFCVLYLYVFNMIKKFIYLDFSYFIDIPHSLYTFTDTLYDRTSVRVYQYLVVDSALNSMYYNEYCFYLHPNTKAFIQSRMEYQDKLKILSDTLNFHEFIHSADELKFFTAFYEHYLKIIELNNDLIKIKKL